MGGTQANDVISSSFFPIIQCGFTLVAIGVCIPDKSGSGYLSDGLDETSIGRLVVLWFCCLVVLVSCRLVVVLLFSCLVWLLNAQTTKSLNHKTTRSFLFIDVFIRQGEGLPRRRGMVADCRSGGGGIPISGYFIETVIFRYCRLWEKNLTLHPETTT